MTDFLRKYWCVEKTMAAILIMMLGIPSCMSVCFGASAGTTLHRYVTPKTEVVTNAWQAVEAAVEDAVKVKSVNGKTGNVELSADDVGAVATNRPISFSDIHSTWFGANEVTAKLDSNGLELNHYDLHPVDGARGANYGIVFDLTGVTSRDTLGNKHQLRLDGKSGYVATEDDVTMATNGLASFAYVTNGLDNKLDNKTKLSGDKESYLLFDGNGLGMYEDFGSLLLFTPSGSLSRNEFGFHIENESGIRNIYLPHEQGTLMLDKYFYEWKTNNSAVVLGNGSTATDSKGIAIGLQNSSGKGTAANGNSSIAIGVHSRTGSSSSQAVAIGANAIANATGAIQIGQGENKNQYSIQFRDKTIVDSNGNIPLNAHALAVQNAVTRINNVDSKMDAWEQFWGGDDVRLTVTNYYGSLGLPTLYLEQKMPPNDDHADYWFKVVWDERTRWDDFLNGDYAAIVDKVNNQLADRAWGFYNSASGSYTPDESYLMIGQPNIQIAPGMEWQKTVTANGCSVWTIVSTGMMGVNTSTNGSLSVKDAEGNPMLEFVKGDLRILPASPSAVEMVDGVFTVKYADSSEPMVKLCTNLVAADWVDASAASFATTTTSKDGSGWKVEVVPSSTTKSMFVQATVAAGAETKAKFDVPVELKKVIIDGTAYTLGTATISGKKVLVLQ